MTLHTVLVIKKALDIMNGHIHVSSSTEKLTEGKLINMWYIVRNVTDLFGFQEPLLHRPIAWTSCNDLIRMIVTDA